MTNHKHHSTTNAECHIASRAYFALRDPALMHQKAGVGQRHSGGKLTVESRAAARRAALSDSRRAYAQSVRGDGHSVSRRCRGPWNFVYKVILDESAPSPGQMYPLVRVPRLEAHATRSTHCASESP